MPHWRRAPLALATGVGLVVSGVACTGEPPPEKAEESPQPLPTAYDAEPPPGVGGEPIRFLHGSGSEGPDVLDDANGVRIESLGEAFLISSNSEERHVLQRAGDGEKLWEGGDRVEGFGRDLDGSEVLILSDDGSGTTVVLDDDGETIWQGQGGREAYLDGLVLRRPDGWSTDDPYGHFAVLDTGGAQIWDFAFEEPEGEDGAGTGSVPERMGVPIGAQEDVVFLDDGSGTLQARDLGEDPGELVWSIAGDDAELAGESTVPRPSPQLVGGYEIPTGEEGDGADEDRAGDTRATVLVRWSLPEDPSLLSLHDLESGELLWSLREPGANPDDHDFSAARVPGTVYDPATQTLLLPQASGGTSMIGVDLAEGEIAWQFEDETERAISPALSVEGYVYGYSRDPEKSRSQLVLDAETKDIVTDELGPYVEAVTDDGYVLVVWHRQRFVFESAGEQGNGEQPSPTRS